MSRPALEVADVFRRFGGAFSVQYARFLTTAHEVVLRALIACRTAVLGGHVWICHNCAHEIQAYNSCNNRHCPKCQAARRKQWYEDRQRELLPVEYFHVVFTLPESIAQLALQNKRLVYTLLFQATSAAMSETAATWKPLQARIGFAAILHTWGQKLDFHPHLHCLVPGGGLSLDSTRWVNCPRGFFLPVRLLSRVFRQKFLDLLVAAYEKNHLPFYGRLSHLNESHAFQQWVAELRQRDWVVYAKPPFGSPEQTLKYLSRYTHRVAISNDRLLSMDQQHVQFRYKDYAHGHRWRTMKLEGTEFIRRFMMHILPHGFMRIRYFGFLANAARQTNLAQIRHMLDVPQPSESPDEPMDASLEWLANVPVRPCPACAQNTLTYYALDPRTTIDQLLRMPSLVPS